MRNDNPIVFLDGLQDDVEDSSGLIKPTKIGALLNLRLHRDGQRNIGDRFNPIGNAFAMFLNHCLDAEELPMIALNTILHIHRCYPLFVE